MTTKMALPPLKLSSKVSHVFISIQHLLSKWKSAWQRSSLGYKAQTSDLSRASRFWDSLEVEGESSDHSVPRMLLCSSVSRCYGAGSLVRKLVLKIHFVC